MGAGACVLEQDERSAVAASKSIDTVLRTWGKRERKAIKLLLLGAGESGKSTIVKQMKIIHSTGFSDEDCLHFRAALNVNLVESMRALVDNMDILGIDYGNPALEQQAQAELFHDGVLYADNLNVRILKLMEMLWMDKGIQRCFERSHTFQISDGAGYLFNHLRQYMAEDFVPTPKDILHIRVRTHGVIMTEFKFKSNDFQLFDVGGQRSERRKWIHCFDNVTAIIFCASLSGYDTTCAEDGTTIRLHESLKLFESICNSCYLQTTSMLLFLNKTDLLRKKVFTSLLTTCFPEYTGRQTFEEVARFIEIKFIERNTSREQIYVHRTCATDTSIVEKVFRVAADTILQENLQNIMA